MRSAHSSRIAGIALGLVLLTSKAWAGDAETERARALFDEAGELERRGQWGAAQERLRAALQLRETPQLYCALGWALENDDKLNEARIEYETALRSGRDRAGAEDAVRLATTRLAELGRTTPMIRVRSALESRILVDGRELTREGDFASTPLDPGSHVVRVEPTAGRAFEQIVYVGRGTDNRVDIDTSDAASTREGEPFRLTSTPMLLPTGKKPNVILPWLLVAGGASLAAGGGALLFAAGADAEQRDAMQSRWCSAVACSGQTATRYETREAASYRLAAAEAARSADAKQAIGVALVGTGVISAAVGTVLLLRADDHTEKKAGDARLRPRASAAPLPGGGFASATFSF